MGRIHTAYIGEDSSILGTVAEIFGDKGTILILNCLVVFNPVEKYMLVKLDHLPRDRGEHEKTLLKPPPSLKALAILILIESSL